MYVYVNVYIATWPMSRRGELCDRERGERGGEGGGRGAFMEMVTLSLNYAFIPFGRQKNKTSVYFRGEKKINRQIN